MEFLKEDGKGSYSRVASFCIVMFTLLWVTLVVIHTAVIPDLTGPALFLGTGTGINYGINQAKVVTKALKGDSNATSTS